MGQVLGLALSMLLSPSFFHISPIRIATRKLYSLHYHNINQVIAMIKNRLQCMAG